jgi:hypothetical protein
MKAGVMPTVKRWPEVIRRSPVLAADWAEGRASPIMESEHAPLRIQVPNLREKLRDAAPDDGRGPGAGVPGVPVRGGGAAAFDVRDEWVRDIGCREVHMSAVEGGRVGRGMNRGDQMNRLAAMLS